MSENRRARQSSSQIRASMVDSGWSENPGPPSEPPPSSRPDVKTRQISAEKLAELVRSAESAPIDPSAPRELPRYDAAPAPADEPERQLEDLVPPDEQTKRIPYAALLGGSQAGRGGPSRPPPAPNAPPVVAAGAKPSADDASPPLPSFPRADSQPDHAVTARAAFDSEPLPVFGGALVPQKTNAQAGSATSPDDEPTVVHQLGPTLKPSRPPVAAGIPEPLAPKPPVAPPPARTPVPVEPKPPVAPPSARTPVPVEPKPPVAPPSARTPVPVEPRPPVAAHGTTSRVASELDMVTAVEPERGLFGALAQRFRFLGLRLPVWTLLPVTAAAVAVPMYLRAQSGARIAAPPPAVSVAPRASVEAEKVAPEAENTGVHAQAARGELEAIERLKQTPQDDRSLKDAVALARGERAQRLKALEPLVERLAKEPEALDDAAFRKDLLEFVVDRSTYVEALAALAQVPTPTAADLLYEVWTGTKKSNEVTRLAKELVYTTDVRKHASDALSVALELRSAETCQESKAAVRRALDYGDRRAFHLLGKLLSTRGCGPDKADDCFPCLRDSGRVEKAIEAVRSRKPPAF